MQKNYLLLSQKKQDLDLIIKDIIDDSKNKSYEILLENKKNRNSSPDIRKRVFRKNKSNTESSIRRD